MLENPIVCKDADYLAVWVYLLLKASHGICPMVFKGEKIMLQPGQLITGRLKIAADLSVNESKVKRILNAFKTDQQIDQQSSNKNSLITILNWESYQKSDQQTDQQMTSERPTDDQQVTTNKNEKNIKNEKNVKKNTYTCAFETLWDAYPRKKEKAMAYKQYLARLNSGFSEDELMTAVKRYAEECKKNNTEQRYIKQGATFLGPSTPFVDYLGDDYKPEDLRVKGKATKFSNFQGRKYDVDSLESQLLQAGTGRIKHESI